MHVKWDFTLILALASNHQSVYLPQSPTEGCGVIPIEGRCMCIDPDPGGPTLHPSFLLRDFALKPH